MAAPRPDDLDRFLPDESWFRFRPRGIHGVPHATRVLVWSAYLVELIGSRHAVRRDELLWAAAVHDVGRESDGIDRDTALARPRGCASDSPSNGLSHPAATWRSLPSSAPGTRSPIRT